MDNQILKDEKLVEVNGGTFAEMKEIREFLKAHDPEFENTPVDEIIASDWLGEHLDCQVVRIKPHGMNEYVFSDSPLNHAQLMDLLRSMY